MRQPIAVLLFILTVMPIWAAQALAADLEVTLTGIRNDSGSIRVAVLNRLAGFPDADNAVALHKEPARPGSMTLHFTGLEPGRYALAVFHDEDDDGELQRLLGLIPLEGYALSGDTGRMGPPSFGRMAFVLTDEGAAMTLPMRY
ncbi:DUF2141 domain-containing protein [Desulfocurvibacter africanus]|uniref:DUF2141 domain-containing protein n=1 Tax=Desulfocurvibacter africanus subsp. africanus str. Walvis Bay TaxID=690850 RepID=F3YYR9_DESAF|nr:DUF2141 domain-containing protein [Desulfocurvibacter africanus]EGJ51895.1 Protein of unknown function DUF2141 [Desulfocurvibacter africanus subsp. africanus str. Walvis Bay]